VSWATFRLGSFIPRNIQSRFPNVLTLLRVSAWAAESCVRHLQSQLPEVTSTRPPRRAACFGLRSAFEHPTCVPLSESKPRRPRYHVTMYPMPASEHRRKRVKIDTACNTCRAKKVRCDGVRPGRLPAPYRSRPYLLPRIRACGAHCSTSWWSHE
jgi:hypothetical protein